eukprot:UN27085
MRVFLQSIVNMGESFLIPPSIQMVASLRCIFSSNLMWLVRYTRMCLNLLHHCSNILQALECLQNPRFRKRRIIFACVLEVLTAFSNVNLN